MMTDAARERIGTQLRREHLCMVRIEASFREIPIGKPRRFRRARTKRVCAVTAFLRFDANPDVDYVQVDLTPTVLADDGDDLQVNLPPVLLTMT